MHLYLLYLIYGWGITSLILMLVIWQKDPPSYGFGSYVLFSAAGILGGIGGGIAASAVESDPMTGIAAALSGALILVGVARLVSGSMTTTR